MPPGSGCFDWGWGGGGGGVGERGPVLPVLRTHADPKLHVQPLGPVLLCHFSSSQDGI